MLFAARGDPSEVFNFVEEALDPVAPSIEHTAEAGLPLAMAHRRDVGGSPDVLHRPAQPVRIIGLVSQDDRARRQRQDQRQAAGVGQGVDPGCQAAARAALQRSGWLFCVGGVLLDPHRGGIDHLHLAVVSFCDGVHNPIEDTGLPPPDEAVVAGCGRPEVLRQSPPRRAPSAAPRRSRSAPVGRQRMERSAVCSAAKAGSHTTRNPLAHTRPSTPFLSGD